MDTPIGFVDKSSNNIFRCERCGCFANPYFVLNDYKKQYTCNICLFTGTIPSNQYDTNSGQMIISKEL